MISPPVRRSLMVAGLWLPAGLLFVRSVAALTPEGWLDAFFAPDPGDIGEMMVHYSALPRFAVALLSGTCLGLSGALFQSVLRNPLAEPATLGVFAGAQLALSVAMLWLPGLLAIVGTWPVAFAGSGLAMALVMGLATIRGLTPVALILAGLVISVYLGSINAMLALFHHDVLSGLFLWQTGSMNQNDWDGVQGLLLFLAIGLASAWLLARPIQLLSLGDEHARGLGVSLIVTRLAAMATAVMLASAVTASVGVIGFIGLLGPLLARLSGSGGRPALWSAIFGAGLLALADQAVQAIPFGDQLSTGTLTAALGAPLLLIMMRRLPPGPVQQEIDAFKLFAPQRSGPGPVLAGLTLLLAICMILALATGRSPGGWQWTGLLSADYLPWRLPRMLAALGAGAAFGISGLLLQRLTGNAMASPEILGVSSGAAIGLVAVVMFSSQIDRLTLYSATSIGAFVTLVVMLSLARRMRFAPEALVLVGIGVVTLFSAVSSILLVSANPQATLLLSWLSGSTYRATLGDGILVMLVVLATIVASPLMARWLSILPLGETASTALGVNVAFARFCVIVAAALTTAAGTLIVGPLGFIGLMAPHIVRLLGLRGGLLEILGASLAGGTIAVMADWLGRNVAFPWQIPAGLASSFVGGTYLMLRLMRR